MLIALLVFAPFLFGILASLTGVRSTKIRNGVLLTAVTAELLISLGLLFDSGTFEIPAVFGNGITFTADGFRSVYALIAAFMWFCTAVFSQEYFRKEPEELGRYYFFFLWTLGATEGVMLSGDFMTAFIFFEILSFTSFTWVIHERTPKAIRAANTYLYIAVIGGLFVFIGILLLKNTVGTLIFSELRDACASCAEGGKMRIASMCILFGFGAKAGMFPLHVWLPKAHPVAPSPASALLSGMLTKVGIYGILMISFQVMLGDLTFGMLVLILGMITMVLGAVLGLFSNELKRTLACSSMSQIGFILTGIGTALLLRAGEALEGAEETTAGVLLYMVNHSLIKLLLFMIAGVVVMNIHRQELNEIQGWGRKHPFLKACFLAGALGISGIPLFNGYLSKTILHEGIVHAGTAMQNYAVLFTAAEWLFLISGGMTLAYMLKLFVCIFVEKNKDADVQREYDNAGSPVNCFSAGILLLASVWMIILGQPWIAEKLSSLMMGAPVLNAYPFFHLENLKGSFISILIGVLFYLILVRKGMKKDGKYRNLWPEKLDLEEAVYRPVLLKVLPRLGTLIARPLGDGLDWLVVLFRKTILKENPFWEQNFNRFKRRDVFIEETKEAVEPILKNFSFALMMTCIGIILILGVLVFYLI